MKKVLVVLATLVVAALAWSSWRAHEINRIFLEDVAADAAMPVVESGLSWGPGRSVAELVVEVDPGEEEGALRSWALARAGDAGPALALRMRHEVHYGPLPLAGWLAGGAEGGPVLAASKIHLTLDGALGAALAEAVGPLPPVTIDSIVRVSGTGESTLHAEPLHYAEDGLEVSWEGLEGLLVFSEDFEDVAGHVRTPGLRVAAGPVEVALGELRWSLDYRQGLEGLPVGTTEVRLARMDLGVPTAGLTWTVEELDLHQASALEDGRLGLDLRYEVARIASGSGEYGPGVLDLRLRGLDADALGETRGALAELKALEGGEGAEAADEEGRAALARTVVGTVPALLSAGPEIELRELSLQTPSGPVRASLRLTVDDSRPELLANPLTALAALRAEADAEVPAPLLAAAVEAWAGRQLAGESEAEVPPRQVAAARDETLRMLRGAGFLVLEGERFVSRASWQGGQLRVNGLTMQLPGAGGDGPVPGDGAPVPAPPGADPRLPEGALPAAPAP